MVARCYFCRGKVSEQRIKVDFRWGEELVVIENVPAEVCQQCGEKYFDAEVYKEMERLAKSKAKPLRHLTIDVIEFEQPVSIKAAG